MTRRNVKVTVARLTVDGKRHYPWAESHKGTAKFSKTYKTCTLGGQMYVKIHGGEGGGNYLSQDDGDVYRIWQESPPISYERANYYHVVRYEYCRFIPTPDNWAPSYPDGMVRVRVCDTTEKWGTPAVRTSAWGMDDLGMERDEYFASPVVARRAYYRRVSEVNGWGIVTQHMLHGLGFVRA